MCKCIGDCFKCIGNTWVFDYSWVTLRRKNLEMLQNWSVYKQKHFEFENHETSQSDLPMTLNLSLTFTFKYLLAHVAAVNAALRRSACWLAAHFFCCSLSDSSSTSCSFSDDRRDELEPRYLNHRACQEIISCKLKINLFRHRNLTIYRIDLIKLKVSKAQRW